MTISDDDDDHGFQLIESSQFTAPLDQDLVLSGNLLTSNEPLII